MAAQQITESEVRLLTQGLHAKDAKLRAKDVELCELKEERSAMLLRCDAYRRASAMMPAVGLNPFDHPVNFNKLRLPDLVSFFTYISEELSRLRAMVGAELDKEGLRAAVAVAGRILSGLRHRNPFVPLDAVFDELAPVDRERALRAVAPCITNVVRLEK